VIGLIHYKHKEHNDAKQTIDPRTNMIHVAQKWNKILKDMQAITKSKTPYNGKMWKNKWKCINSNYKKKVNYHKGIGHHTSYWEMSIDEQDKFHSQR
jgi:hypothetical protein